MTIRADLTLRGRDIELVPLHRTHVDALAAIAASDVPLYRWSPVPQSTSAMLEYIETALRWQAAGTAIPFAIVRDGKVAGSTRFFNIEYWPWPRDHERALRGQPDTCEIGYTWLAPAVIRTGVNTEIKRIMLTHAFEAWHVASLCLHTDERNERSRAAIERIGGTFEGILRGHRLAADIRPRNSCRYSIIASEWPGVRARIEALQRR